MRIVKRGTNLFLVLRMRDMARHLSNDRGRTELHRGVIDAGRRMKTINQKTVQRQMALKPGNYGSYVVAGTRGIPRKKTLSYEIFGVKGGAKIEQYKGLMSVKSSGRAARRMNAGRVTSDRGTVRSGVWNNPRVFKRSFATGTGFFAMRPPSAGTSSRAPKALWTYGSKPGQPRGADGRFAPSGTRYGKVRRLFGPSLMKEIPKDDSLDVFLRHGPALLERHVGKRLTKLMRF
ncbi:protein of unknown function [Pseudorhizobium banfieldiae]|uniref:Uncharacterized protein n=1 Tax=Pseudorhizobium banfieldiae TaxID=1125847 RepID=L0NED6_9HYPH|nr:hypothetical protein [Pseudorhizobium banfieldiae]CAD6606185.1 hypothetical protein RNT25_01806 [arsenite-oxidising bacterium NT-25]CCF19151.1 protein of unknown function [Pseudorhizobium banfieldiae]